MNKKSYQKLKSVAATSLIFGMGLMATGTADAADSCGDNLDSRLSDLKKEIAELKTLLGQNPAPVDPPSQTPVACASINLRTAGLGTKCTTSNGAIYERVSRNNFGEAWKGPDGLIWGDRAGDARQYDAVTTCKNLGGTLPERADFDRGEANGFREVLPHMKDHAFWSSSEDLNDSDSAYGFYGDSGGIYNVARRLYDSVRCVGR